MLLTAQSALTLRENLSSPSRLQQMPVLTIQLTLESYVSPPVQRWLRNHDFHL